MTRAALAIRLTGTAIVLIGVGGVLINAVASAQSIAPGDSTSPYRVECSDETDESPPRCRVDVATYIGRRVFHTHCATCHAEDALGSTFAPALADRIRRMDFEDFTDALDNGYSGIEDVMPAWGENRDVARYYYELWSYLLARASGDLPPGVVELL